ncbi:DUF342 domain-containing protein [Christensenella intestinihominis]|uniref:DUF342 domain-containing protein n=2 Tax=Christensenella intestinihominis TaxID=1851429 RepID=UPI00082F021E|nr:FapA family protein [Christensenella intestinihominis]
MAGDYVPKQNMIDEILKDLQAASETVDTISEEDIAAQIANGLGQPDSDLVKNLLEQTKEMEGGDSEAISIQKIAPSIPDTSKSIDAQVLIDVSPDLMSARIRITPPRMGGRTITEDDILEKLREERIIKGIKFEYVYRLAHHTVYNRAFKIAQGVPPVDGEDARLHYHFKESEEPNNFRNAEDYAQIHYVEVKSGDILCEVEDATPARNGWNIRGKSLAGVDGKTLGDVTGDNTMEFNNALYATCDGLVSIKDSKVSVYPSQTEQELDNRTLAAEGTVLVEGNVINGSVIESEGDIIVKGSVQNSKLSSNGNIIICKGVTGSSIIEAKGALRSYFIENAQVKVEKDIITDVIMRADIFCGGTLRLAGKHENLLGGTSEIGGDLYAGNIGNSANIPTEIFLMRKEQIRKEKEKALERINECRQTIDQLMEALQKALGAKQPKEVRKKLAIDIIYAKKKLEQEIENQNELLKELYNKEGATKSGKVVVTGLLFPNVNLNIDGVFYRNEKEQAHCTITRHHSELLFSAVKEDSRR